MWATIEYWKGRIEFVILISVINSELFSPEVGLLAAFLLPTCLCSVSRPLVGGKFCILSQFLLVCLLVSRNDSMRRDVIFSVLIVSFLWWCSLASLDQPFEEFVIKRQVPRCCPTHHAWYRSLGPIVTHFMCRPIRLNTRTGANCIFIVYVINYPCDGPSGCCNNLAYHRGKQGRYEGFYQ